MFIDIVSEILVIISKNIKNLVIYACIYMDTVPDFQIFGRTEILNNSFSSRIAYSINTQY